MKFNFKYVYIIFYTSSIWIIGSCNINTNTNKVQKTKLLNNNDTNVIDNKKIELKKTNSFLVVNPKNKKIFTYKTEIQSGNYSLCIETTCLNDSLSPIEAGYTFPVIKQLLNFQLNDRIIKSFNHPVQSCKRKLKNGRKVKTLENEIIKIGVLHGEKGDIYYVVGGSCNACSEFDGFYSLKGETIWYSYTFYKTTDEQWIKSVKDYNEMLQTYGIFKRDIEMISVLPIDSWNVKSKSRITKPVIK